MNFVATTIEGAFLIELRSNEDERGSFTRVFCAETFSRHGLPREFPQTSISTNNRLGTLRGLHYQAPPDGEGKLLRCSRGALFDVAVDLRPASPTFRGVLTVELEDASPRAIYLPPGCAHGFLTLRDDTEVVYQISVPYAAHAARGVRWDDPDLAIPWPMPPTVISDRDRSLPLLREAYP
jgi:dTDP-4-dehydrorhamnose 3,5-epimerase